MTDSVSSDRPGPDRPGADRPRPPVARWVKIVGMVVLGVIGVALFALAFGYFVKLLWNWLMPAIFGLGTISYWQAFGIVVLAKLIFGGIGGGGHRNGRRHGTPRHQGVWSGEGHGDWRGFWNEEGKEAFRRYTERKRAERWGKEPESTDPAR